MEPMYRIVVEYDLDPDLSWLNTLYENEDDYNKNRVFVPRLGRYLTYEEYIDPRNWDVFFVMLQRLCPECGHWSTIDSIGGVTYFTFACPVYPGTFSLEEARDMDPYLLELLELEGVA